MLFNTKFILASESKSRKNMLKKNNLNFFQIPPKCNEEKIKSERKKISAKALSLLLAKSKAASIAEENKNTLVVGADTVIELKKKIITKAKNKKEAKKKLKKLSGKEHHIYSTAVAIYKKKVVWKNTQKTTIKIRKLSNKEINYYLKKTKKDILSSVGCFQIENDGPNIIESIKGDFFNVMGFPLFQFLFFLKEFGNKK
tara:strand:- start:1037 stop:1633 length:597 start_codon:yes stop_codon:yes gene_type:complete